MDDASGDEGKSLPQVPDRCGPPIIPLSVLLDFAVQNVYHEITVLSELMQKKTDQDKKISLVTFAHNTRMQFVKLLALVKWIKTSKKFDQCSSICYLLDQQAQFYIDTADRMVMMSRGDLVLARLPPFQILPAIDILTQGTYSRLPMCIKDAFIPAPKITPREQAQVLARLNQVIEYRISRASHTIPASMKVAIVKNGMAIFAVPGEFEIRLTLLGERESVKWTLLDIKILVEDYEIGYGMELVHPQQLSVLHEVLQSRMNCSKNPIPEAYNYLHSFCVSLQLDVLFCQTSQLATGRLRDNIVIEKYDPKERVLTVGYWVKRMSNMKTTLGVPKTIPQYRIQIFLDHDDEESGLKVRHYPHILQLGKLEVTQGKLSMDQLLSDSFLIRCRERLLRIRRFIESADAKLQVHLTGCNAPSLTVCLFNNDIDVVKEEQLIIYVNSFTGKIICDVSVLDHSDLLKELGRILYANLPRETIRRSLMEIRIAVIVERYRRSIKALAVRERKNAEMEKYIQYLPDLSKHRIFLQFIKAESYHLVVNFDIDKDDMVRIHLSLMETKDDRAQYLQLTDEERIFKRPIATALNHEHLQIDKNSSGVRPLLDQRLAAAVSRIEDRLTMLFVCEELARKGVSFELREEDPHAPGSIALHITDISQAIEINCPQFFKTMVRCCLRIDNRSRVTYPFECCFENIPLVRDVPFGLPHRRKGKKEWTWIYEVNPIQAQASEKIADQIIDRLSKYLHMYSVIHKFAKAYHAYYHQFCSIEAYTFHKLVVSYGDRRDQLLILAFSIPKKTAGTAVITSTSNNTTGNSGNTNQEQFSVNFGQSMPHATYNSSEIDWKGKTRWNPHSMMATNLREKLNKDSDLVDLVQFLISSVDAMKALGSFMRIRFQSKKILAQLMCSEVHFPFRIKYHLIAVNETTLRLMIGFIILEFILLGDGQVAIRDCCKKEPRCPALAQVLKRLNGQLVEPAELAEISQRMAHAAALSVSEEASTSSPMISPSNELCSTQPVVVSHQTLQNSCDFQLVAGRLTCPLNEYFEALIYLNQARITVEALTTQKSPLGTVHTGMAPTVGLVTVVDVTKYLVAFKAVQVNGAGTSSALNVHYQLYLCPETSQVKITIKYDEGPATPSTEDVQTMCTFFDKIVYQTKNEFTLEAFILLTRITAHGASNSIASMMSAHMEPAPAVGNHIYIQLAYMTRESTQHMGRRFSVGVMIDVNLISVMIVITIKRFGGTPNPQTKMYRIIYNSQANAIRIQDPQQSSGNSERNEELANICSMANAEAAAATECSVWPAMRMLIDRFSPNFSVGSVRSVLSNPPSTLPNIPSVPPASVQMQSEMPAPGSVGSAQQQFQ